MQKPSTRTFRTRDRGSEVVSTISTEQLVQDLNNLRATITAASNRLKELLTTLREDFGIKTVDRAEAKLDELNKVLHEKRALLNSRKEELKGVLDDAERILQ